MISPACRKQAEIGKPSLLVSVVGHLFAEIVSPSTVHPVGSYQQDGIAKLSLVISAGGHQQASSAHFACFLDILEAHAPTPPLQPSRPLVFRFCLQLSLKHVSCDAIHTPAAGMLPVVQHARRVSTAYVLSASVRSVRAVSEPTCQGPRPFGRHCVNAVGGFCIGPAEAHSRNAQQLRFYE